MILTTLICWPRLSDWKLNFKSNRHWREKEKKGKGHKKMSFHHHLAFVTIFAHVASFASPPFKPFFYFYKMRFQLSTSLLLFSFVFVVVVVTSYLFSISPRGIIDMKVINIKTEKKISKTCCTFIFLVWWTKEEGGKKYQKNYYRFQKFKIMLSFQYVYFYRNFQRFNFRLRHEIGLIAIEWFTFNWSWKRLCRSLWFKWVFMILICWLHVIIW